LIKVAQLSAILLMAGIRATLADVSESVDYKAVHQAEVTAGQQLSGSPDYRVLAVLGGSSALGGSGNYTAVAGISCGMFNVNDLTIRTDPTQLPEGGTATVFGLASYDDNTSALVPGSELATTFSGGAQGVTLSPQGTITAPPVYQNMNVTLLGSYAGLTASSILSVLDIEKDNWGALAGDGFPDDWQNRMGVTSTLTKTGDNDADGRSNALEYVLNTNPIIPNSEPISQMGQVASDGWNYLTITVRRNKAVSPSASYVGKESFDLTRWLRHTDAPSVTSLDAETELVRVTSVYPIGYLDKGFLAMDITIPESFVPASPSLTPTGISLANTAP
jgi:hypothetical protein